MDLLGVEATSVSFDPFLPWPWLYDFFRRCRRRHQQPRWSRRHWRRPRACRPMIASVTVQSQRWSGRSLSMKESGLHTPNYISHIMQQNESAPGLFSNQGNDRNSHTHLKIQFRSERVSALSLPLKVWNHFWCQPHDAMSMALLRILWLISLPLPHYKL
jgi:hypothetical protein